MTLALLAAALAFGSEVTVKDAAPEKAVLGGVDASSEVTDPDMLAALGGAEESNLENAMAKARGECERTAALLIELWASGRAQAGGLAEDAGEGYSADLERLDGREKAFRGAASAAGLRLPAPEPDKLLLARQGYRAADRLRDLRLAEDWTSAAARKAPKVRLDSSAKALVSAAAGLREELLRAAKAAERLAPGHAQRRAALSADAQALKTEAGLLERQLLLDAHDQAAFDVLPEEDEE